MGETPAVNERRISSFLCGRASAGCVNHLRPPHPPAPSPTQGRGGAARAFWLPLSPCGRGGRGVRGDSLLAAEKHVKVYEIRGGFGLDALHLVEQARRRARPRRGAAEDEGRGRSTTATCWSSRGSTTRRLPLPLVRCSDGVGEVAAVGAGVTRVKVGRPRRRRLHAGLGRRRADRGEGAIGPGRRRSTACWPSTSCCPRTASSPVPDAPVRRGGGHAALRRRDRLARAWSTAGRRQAGRHGAAAGHRRRLALRAAVRPAGRARA